jgi:hypothetical protein
LWGALKKDFRKILVPLLGFLIFPIVAHAQPEEYACNYHIDKIINHLQDVEKTVPFVPPEEDEYLSKEFKAIFGDVSSSSHKNQSTRFNVLQTRPYYFSWYLHNDFDKANESLKALKKLSPKTSIKVQIQTAAYIPYALSNARDAWDKYSDNTNMDFAQARDGAYAMTAVGGVFAAYLKCLAAQINN